MACKSGLYIMSKKNKKKNKTNYQEFGVTYNKAEWNGSRKNRRNRNKKIKNYPNNSFSNKNNDFS
jgi:hypothetical protein